MKSLATYDHLSVSYLCLNFPCCHIFSSAMLIAKSKNKKKKRSLIVLEGKRLIKDAIAAGYVPQKVFFSRVKDAADLNLPNEGVELYKTSYKSISLWSDLTTSPGVLGESILIT